MDAKELRLKNGEEVKKLIQQLRIQQRQLRFTLATERVTNPRKLRQVRRNIARAKTILNQASVVSS